MPEAHVIMARGHVRSKGKIEHAILVYLIDPQPDLMCNFVK